MIAIRPRIPPATATLSRTSTKSDHHQHCNKPTNHLGSFPRLPERTPMSYPAARSENRSVAAENLVEAFDPAEVAELVGVDHRVDAGHLLAVAIRVPSPQSRHLRPRSGSRPGWPLISAGRRRDPDRRADGLGPVDDGAGDPVGAAQSGAPEPAPCRRRRRAAPRRAPAATPGRSHVAVRRRRRRNAPASSSRCLPSLEARAPLATSRRRARPRAGGVVLALADDLGDLGVAVVEDVVQQEDGALLGRQALEQDEEGDSESESASSACSRRVGAGRR